MPRRREKKRVSFSKIYTFQCGRSSLKDDYSQIGGPGFSRVVFCNEPDNPQAALMRYASNYVSTTKYTLITFVPKSLFEQFRRVANIYFLICGCLAFTSLSPYSGVSALLPLAFVIGVTMIKEAIEDWRRQQQDMEVNNRKVKVHHGDGIFEDIEWKKLRVGDIVRVEKDEFFPADLLLLSSSYDDGICYVETSNLDGETNLKMKQALEATSRFCDDASFHQFQSMVRCEDPNANLYSFVGSMLYENEQCPLSPQQILLRDSKLRNTDFIYGTVIFTGHDTKVIQNSTDPPSKRSNIEKKMDALVYFLFALMTVISAIGSVFFGIWTAADLVNGVMSRWYLRPDDTSLLFDPQRAVLAALCHFLTALMLYSYFIPISLYVSIEIVKILQSVFINQDREMYYEEYDRPAMARTSNLNEELGQVHTILSDKTGTLTCNSMEFVKCSIGGVAYGTGTTEVERAMAKRKGSPLLQGISSFELGDEENGSSTSPSVKGFNFKDDRIVNGNWVREPNADVVQKFFRVLAICHTCIPDFDEDSRSISYEAESPDEAAFVIAARELGFQFFERTHTCILLRELDPVSGEQVKRSYKLLNILEFSSSRKRMSVIVKDEEDHILLLSKGADSVMFERLADNGRQFEEETMQHINEYADAGLRTLVLAYREINEEEYTKFSVEFLTAKNSVGENRDEEIDVVASEIERDLLLLGATAVEDKLQKGVPECIDKLAQAGIKIWVLTGDKRETAINIGFACSLLRQDMEQILITLESPEILALEKQQDKAALSKASKESVIRQIDTGTARVNSPAQGASSFALIIDGRSLAFALEHDVEKSFIEMAMGCASVICCRSSPKQKALVTRLVKQGTRKTILAIGDGANDVGMLQEADIGVGIAGVEGMQAAMSSDVAIAQFRFLERLLLVHGHWCYRRISLMVLYFFYKNIVFGFILLWYESYTSFSGQTLFNDWCMTFYNIFFTGLPVLALGVFDQDVSAKSCLRFPLLYQEGVKNVLFNWKQIFAWMFNAAYSSIIIFALCAKSLEYQAFRKDGELASMDILGTMMFTCIVWIVNCQLALAVSYFTWIQHLFIWGSIAAWYLFLLVYGEITPTTSTTAFMILIEACGPAISYWLVTVLVVVSTLIPFLIYAYIQRRFFPMYHHMIQYVNFRGRDNDPEYCNSMHPPEFQHKTVGFSARKHDKEGHKKPELYRRKITNE